jgi:MEMO1 family protein
MASLDRPKLRPLIRRRIDQDGLSYIALQDPLGIATHPVVLTLEGYLWIVQHFDGDHSLADIQAQVLRQYGRLVSSAEMQNVVSQLEDALLLDGPSFAVYQQQYKQLRTRPAALAGRSYAGSERALRAQLGRIFADADAAGHPGKCSVARDGRLRGIVSPHIDFQRGGPTYTWSYRELVEQSDADVFVIFGVAHQYCARRFALTCKDFETPLGLARTDRTYVDRIAALAGNHVFDDELAHRTEHSIEFQVVFLQYLLGGTREFSIVPILVGSFQDLMESGVEPASDPEVRRMIEAVRVAEAASGKKVAYIGGIDLSHVGPEFDDPDPVDETTRDSVRAFDSAMLECAAAGDATGWFRTAAAVGNRWRVCGLAATYTMLQVMGPTPGRVLRYDQSLNPDRTCLVTFASLAFTERQPYEPDLND